MDDISKLTFEAAYAQLEHLIARLESGELSLEESVSLFERGRALSAHCQALLDTAELRVNRLADDNTLESLD